MAPAQEAWKRLGELLRARRAEIDGRYRVAEVFYAERGINRRLASDLEHARRTNFEPGSLALAEQAYGLVPRSIARFLADGTLPAPAGSDGDDRPEAVRANWDDENVRDLWGLKVGPEQRLGLIEVYLEGAAAEQRGA